LRLRSSLFVVYKKIKLMCFIKWVCFNLFLRERKMKKLKQKTQKDIILMTCQKVKRG